MSFRRLSRIGLPAVGVTCALGGLVFLALLEVAPVEPRTEVQQAAQPQGAHARPAIAPGASSFAARATPTLVSRPFSVTPKTDTPRLRKIRAAQGLAGELHRTKGLAQRLAHLDKRIATFSPRPALTVLDGLLHTPLFGTKYEVQTLRLAILGRIGRLALPEADAVLVTYLGGEIPRPERLVAIELMAGRQGGRDELTLLAQRDHDPRVQERARWALAR